MFKRPRHRTFTLIFTAFVLLSTSLFSQDTLPYDQKPFDPVKFKLVLAGGALFYGGTLAGLSTLWYRDQDWVGFHWFNDNNGWEQVDKFGHAYTSYMMGKVGMEALKWSGVERKKAIIYGGSYGFLFLSSVEFLDGHYAAWGASPGDLGANAFGSLLLISQELAFNKQVVTMKFSYHPTDLAKERPDHLGKNWNESIIKDYNGHTYWFSVNYRDIFRHHTVVPKWLCISGGYGAYGMLGGDENPEYYNYHRLPYVDRYKRYFLSLDVDFQKIHTRSRFLRKTFFLLNLIKFPLPTMEYNANQGWVFHPVYF